MRKNVKKPKLEFIDRIAYGAIETSKFSSILYADVYTYGNSQISDRVQALFSRTGSYYVFHLN